MITTCFSLTWMQFSTGLLRIFAERLSAWGYYNLAERLSVVGLWLHFCPALGMQLKVWLVRKHQSRLGIQLNVLLTKSCDHLRKFIVFSAVAALAVSFSCVLIFSTNRTICWDSGITTVGWRKYHTSQTQQWIIANISISTGDSRTSCHWGEL